MYINGNDIYPERYRYSNPKALEVFDGGKQYIHPTRFISHIQGYFPALGWARIENVSGDSVEEVKQKAIEKIEEFMGHWNYYEPIRTIPFQGMK